MLLRRIGFTAGLALLGTPALAQAQNCEGLRAQLSQANSELGGIALDYPKTHLAIVACIYGNDKQSDQQGCVSTVIFGSCIGLGADGCSDLTTRWARVALRYYSIIPQMNAIGCKP